MSTQPPLSFNPRDVAAMPSLRVESAVAGACLTAQAIRERFASHVAWTPDVVQEPVWPDIGRMRPAAVLVGLVEREQVYLVLTHRAAHLKQHAAQVAFAGGKIDATDGSAEDAALREAQEEIGVPAHAVQVLGRLSEYSTGTGFHIVPVVGFISSDVVYQPDPSEVEQVFEVPLAFITDPTNHRYHMVVRDGVERCWWSMPYTDAQGYEHYIWGATAGMLRNLYQYLLAPVR